MVKKYKIILSHLKGGDITEYCQEFIKFLSGNSEKKIQRYPRKQGRARKRKKKEISRKYCKNLAKQPGPPSLFYLAYFSFAPSSLNMHNAFRE